VKDQETQQRFIIMRSQGMTFARIAEELNISRGTLVNWSRKFIHEIQNLRVIELEALQEQLIATREKRVRHLGGFLSRVEEEINKRNFSEVSTCRLFGLAESLRHQIKNELGGLEFSGYYSDVPEGQQVAQVTWKP
jgi:hypothetical protein